MAKKMTVKYSDKKGSKKAFTPCSRCPNPKACADAEMCLAERLNG